MQPDQAQLDDLVRRIVDAVHPLRIILFGSAARGEMGPDDDVDVMVVVTEGTSHKQTIKDLYTRVDGGGLALDYRVSTPSDLEEYATACGTAQYKVAREGRELYAT